MIKVFFVVLVLCTAAIIAVILAIHFRVKRHLNAEPGLPASPTFGLGQVAEQVDAQVSAVAESSADTARESRAERFS